MPAGIRPTRDDESTEVRPIRALALLVALGFMVAGCASGNETNSGQRTPPAHHNATFGPIVMTGTRTRTIANVKTGTYVRCKGGSGANVPRRGVGVSQSSGVSAVGSATSAPPPAEISLMHLPNGSITVTCRP